MSKLVIEIDEQGSNVGRVLVDGEPIGGVQKLTLLYTTKGFTGSLKLYVPPGNEKFLKLLEPFKKWLMVSKV